MKRAIGMSEVFAVLSAVAVTVHLAFVAFVMTGAALSLRWRWIPWVHVPAAAWATFVELSGRICPLTPLENTLRARAGLAPYSGDFIARYVFPVLYPEGLTRDLQMVFGATVVIVNLLVYGWMLRRGRDVHASRRSAEER